MSQHISHEEYVDSVRKRVVAIALGILDGSVNVLEGAHVLFTLQREAEVDYNDRDFGTFVAICSETDALPIGKVREHWSAEALARLEPEIQSATAWAMRLATPACKSIIQRFGA